MDIAREDHRIGLLHLLELTQKPLARRIVPRPLVHAVKLRLARTATHTTDHHLLAQYIPTRFGFLKMRKQPRLLLRAEHRRLRMHRSPIELLGAIPIGLIGSVLPGIEHRKTR